MALRALEEDVRDLCLGRGWSLAVAESCTGGLLGGRLTSLPGSSAWFEGGVIAYSNGLKKSLLGVPQKMLEREGAVSGPVAEAMARGAVRITGARCGIAITGVAGPDGGTGEKPVGTVWVAVALPSDVTSRSFRFTGSRERVRTEAVKAAMELFLESAGS